MSRAQKALGGLLLLQVVLILLFRSPFTGATVGTEVRPLLPGLEAFSPTRLQLETGGDADEKTLTLSKQGDSWVVDEMQSFPADGNKIDEVLDDLREITVRRPVVSSARYHKTFKVAEKENEGRIRIWGDGDDDPRVDLILGNSPNYQITHVRMAGEEPVYEARGVAAYQFQAEPANWVEKELLEVEEGQLVGISVDNGAGEFELTRVDGAWTITAPADRAGQTLDNDKVDTFLRGARSIRLADAVGVEDASHGFTDSPARVELRWTAAEGQTESAVVRIGGTVADQDSQRYITREGWGFTGSIWESSVKKLLDQDLDDLLPTPEEEAS